jgi:hypothetical protein
VKSIISILILTLGVSCASTKKQSNVDLNKLVSEYEVSAKVLLSNNRKKKSKKTMIKSANDLISKAKPILVEFSARNPQCKELLDVIIKSDVKMGNLSLHEIEDQFHEGSALPEADDLCFEAKELIVHPATVIVISKKYKLKKGQRVQINDEIAEVLGHLGLFKETI